MIKTPGCYAAERKARVLFGQIESEVIYSEREAQDSWVS
jgi:hypothetical protein